MPSATNAHHVHNGNIKYAIPVSVIEYKNNIYPPVNSGYPSTSGGGGTNSMYDIS